MIMVINKEKSLKFRSIKSKKNLNLTYIGDNVHLNKKFEVIYKNALLDVGRSEAAKSRYNYYVNVQNADISKYDSKFVDLFRNGSVNFYGEEYLVKYLYFQRGTINGITRNIITTIKEKDSLHDLITKDDMSLFKRDKIMGLKWSKFFYDLYLLCVKSNLLKENKIYINDDIKDDVVKLLKEYDGVEEHTKVPESYYKFNQM